MEYARTITRYEEGLEFEYHHSKEDPPELVTIHSHDFYELYYFISGDMTYYVEGQAYSMNRGDFLIMGTDEIHSAQPNSDAPYERIVINFSRAYISSFEQEGKTLLNFMTKRKLGHSNLLEASKINTTPIYNHILRIDKVVKTDSPYKSMLIKTHLIQLLVELNRIYSTQVDSIITPKHYDERVSSILKYLNDNISKKITLDDLEKEFFINKYHLCHIFKKNTGFTIFEYISNKRIMRAKQLLSKGMPVIDTCYAVGFSDYSNFYKVFKKVAGIPPKKFALQN